MFFDPYDDLNETTTFVPATDGWRELLLDLHTAQFTTRALRGWLVTPTPDGPHILPDKGPHQYPLIHCGFAGPGDPLPEHPHALHQWYLSRWIRSHMEPEHELDLHLIDGKWYREGHFDEDDRLHLVRLPEAPDYKLLYAIAREWLNNTTPYHADLHDALAQEIATFTGDLIRRKVSRFKRGPDSFLGEYILTDEEA